MEGHKIFRGWQNYCYQKADEGLPVAVCDRNFLFKIESFGNKRNSLAIPAFTKMYVTNKTFKIYQRRVPKFSVICEKKKFYNKTKT